MAEEAEPAEQWQGGGCAGQRAAQSQLPAPADL